MKKKTIAIKIVGSAITTENQEQKLWQHRIVVLMLTFLVYTTYHLSRKPMSVVKSKLNQNGTTKGWAPFNEPDGKNLLSLMDGVYWGTYAVGMFLSGYIAERSDLRYFLTFSLTLCGLLCIASGLAYSFEIHSLSYFLVTQVLSGLSQTTGWPGVLAVIGSWFGSAKKGMIFGVWSLHTSFGNILGTIIAGLFVDTNWGLSFIIPGLICIGMAVLVFFLQISKPKDIGLKVDLKSASENDTFPTSSSSSSEKLTPKQKDEAISFWNALKIPGVVEFSICLFFTKCVSYIFINWLPKFLEEKTKLSSSKSAYISIMFDIGGCVGSIIAGILSDQTSSSGSICVAFLMMGIPSLYLFNKFSPISMLTNLSLQFITGFFIIGPYSLITTAVSADLACKVPSKSAMATVSAIIDGTGSIGAALGPALTGPLSSVGWDLVFFVCMGCALVAMLCLVRVSLKEIKQWREK